MSSSVLATVAEIRARLAAVRDRVDAVRAPDQNVVVVGVTKTFPPELVSRAAAAGLQHIGENYAQELLAKANHLAGAEPDLAVDVKWHFIGGLQRNKIKMVGDAVYLWQTVDRPSLITELAKRCPGARIMIQVNTTDEPQKSGCEPGEAPALVEAGLERDLDVVGLMTIGPTGGQDPRPAFDLLRGLAADLGLPQLSMGMSGDYEVAVEHGSTMIRVGSALFGSRR